MNPLRILVIGGHGKVSLSFTSQAMKAGHQVFSLLRNEAHISDLPTAGPGQVKPIVASLEDSSVSDLSNLFLKEQVDTVIFAAGSGGKGGAERTKAVDLEGAIRTFDAIQLATTSGLSNFNRFILVSAVDSRDLNIKPRWYSEEDFEKSRKSREALGYYYQCKYEADKNLHDRSKKGDLTFPWFVLRPSTLQDESGTGKANLGEQKGIAVPIPREDVATVLLRLSELPKGTADGLALDCTSGDVEIKEALEKAAKRGRTDWVG